MDDGLFDLGFELFEHCVEIFVGIPLVEEVWEVGVRGEGELFFEGLSLLGGRGEVSVVIETAFSDSYDLLLSEEGGDFISDLSVPL